MTTAAPTRRHQMAAMRRLLGAAVALILLAPAVSAHADDDPNLDQSIGTDQQVVAGEQVLDDGHVDMGPKFVDG